ncbi:transporter [Aquincola sp. S2]|uniref:Transporter n=1 Tax=Pseudaquabacterium terrae TaxID=2732868 RepID=A0ABX2EJX2_9BURK|nr:transporter [Aquabacterium terrae]NRF68913.1 transporter [Aquabacterium terrae]
MSDSTTPASFSFDSADDGLICGYHFRPGQAGAPIASTTEALALLEREAGRHEGFVWLHMNLSHAAALPWLRAHAGLADSFFEALDEGSRSTRIERDGDALYAVVNDVTFDFKFDAADVATLWVGVQRDLVVSARRHPLRAVDRLRMAVKRGEALDSSVALLDHLLRDQADELQRIVRSTVERIDDIEDALLAGKGDQLERHDTELARLRRLAVRLQRLLAPEPGALMRTLSRPPGWVSAEDRQHLHRASEEFGVVLRDIAALQDRIKLMQDEAAARVATQNNRSLFTLTMVTVLALPINLVSGLFGMNVGGIPLAGHGLGFWVMLAIIAGLTGAIAGVALRMLRGQR